MSYEVSDFCLRLKAYAELLIRRGVNLQPGQTLILAAPAEAYAFTRIVAQAAWDAGARDVSIRWSDTPAGEQRLRHASKETLTSVPEWISKSYNDYADRDTVWLALACEYPPPAGMDTDKTSAARIASIKAIKPFFDARLNGTVRWNIASVATRPWAQLVFPDMEPDAALQRLWHDILLCARCLQGEPTAAAAVQAWDAHIARNNAYRDKLNAAGFTELRFISGIGTDLVLGLPAGYHFVATEETDPEGIRYIANIPSEEIFAGPDRLRVNGKVVASMPLFYNFALIYDLWFEFRDGRVVDFGCDTEEHREVVRQLLETDEGSRYLGEVALVPWGATVGATGHLYYTTLFDENAACHLALGESYPETIDGGVDMSDEQLLSAGMNKSLAHVDFMFGTADLEIVGVTADGAEIPVFSAGTWAC
ncbi:MAG: aminopeptidase [Actinomycetes bacterium]|jgi:aminopeptidase|nr:aminopeptidase [Actinomycetes bacterium]